MRRFWVAAALSLILAWGCSDPGEEFAAGLGVIPAPDGEWVAVRESEAGWAVYDGAGKRLLAIESPDAPLWLEGIPGGSLVFRTAEGLRRAVLPEGRVVNLPIRGQTFRPVQALDKGRLLLGYEEKDELRGMLVLNAGDSEPPQSANATPSCTWLEGPPALSLKASHDGERVSLAREDGHPFRITVLRRAKEGEAPGYAPEAEIPNAQSSEHFWSPSGRFLFYASADGCLELLDLCNSTSQWIANAAFVPNPAVAFQAPFSPNDDCIYLEAEDRYGFRQIELIRTADACGSKFSQGGIDHYGPVLSRDGRFIAYRQGYLPRSDAKAAQDGIDEILFLFDFKTGRILRLGDRRVRPGSTEEGPAFSGNLRYLYYMKGDRVFRCDLAAWMPP